MVGSYQVVWSLPSSEPNQGVVPEERYEDAENGEGDMEGNDDSDHDVAAPDSAPKRHRLGCGSIFNVSFIAR